MRIGRVSSVAAANVTSDSARRRSFWGTRVVGRSPPWGMTGNSSASMPRRWVWKRPARIRSVCSFSTSRSTRSPAGRPDTMSVMSRAGTVSAPSTSILPGTQAEMPISRFVAVRRRPPSWVRRSTFVSTGRLARPLTARLTRERPRARFSCIKDSFTTVVLPSGVGVEVICIFSPHHHLHGVDTGGSRRLDEHDPTLTGRRR